MVLKGIAHQGPDCVFPDLRAVAPPAFTERPHQGDDQPVFSYGISQKCILWRKVREILVGKNDFGYQSSVKCMNNRLVNPADLSQNSAGRGTKRPGIFIK